VPAQPGGPSAIVIPLPEAESTVGAWRDRYDPSAQQGMPAHITLLYPFLPEDRLTANVVTRLTQLFARQPGFDVQLTGCARFPGGVLYVSPEPGHQLRALTAAITQNWPETPPYGGMFNEVVPHVTVAVQVEPDIADQIEQHLRPTLPIHATIREAWLYTPNASRWAPKHRLPLLAPQR
jgi:2'-5' RNA ligase